MYIICIVSLMAAIAGPVSFERHDIADFRNVYQLAVADMNGDGKLDIVVSAGRNNKILWYENR